MHKRIPFDSLTLSAVVSELKQRLQGGQLQQVSQPIDSDLALTIHKNSASLVLLLSCDSIYPRAHLTTQKRANPATPHAFCMACRKHIDGAALLSVCQRGFDRVLELEFRTSSGDIFKLIGEFMGKHSNFSTSCYRDPSTSIFSTTCHPSSAIGLALLPASTACRLAAVPSTTRPMMPCKMPAMRNML